LNFKRTLWNFWGKCHFDEERYKACYEDYTISFKFKAQWVCVCLEWFSNPKTLQIYTNHSSYQLYNWGDQKKFMNHSFSSHPKPLASLVLLHKTKEHFSSCCHSCWDQGTSSSKLSKQPKTTRTLSPINSSPWYNLVL